MTHDCAAVEQQLLGGLIRQPERLSDVQGILASADDFGSRRHQALYKAICVLDEAGEAVDAGMLVTLLGTQPEAAALAPGDGWKDLVLGAMTSVTSGARVQSHARTVARSAVLRRLAGICRQATDEVEDVRPGVPDEVEQFTNQLEARIHDAGEGLIGGATQSFAEAVAEAWREMESPRERGAPTGFFDLDDKINGLRPGELVVVAARPGVGKTTLAVQLMLNATRGGDHRALMFSLEMSTPQLAMRCLANESGVSARRLRAGKADADELAAIEAARAGLADRRIEFLDDVGATPQRVRSVARRLQSRGGLDVVVIDYLQLMRDPGSENRLQEVSGISRALKGIARELGVCVVAVSQLSRAAEDSSRPKLRHLRESGQIEADADVVLLLWPDEKTPGVLRCGVAKNRHGEGGDFAMQHEAHLFSLRNYIPEGVAL